MPRPAQGSRTVETLLVAFGFVVGAVARFVPETPLWLDEALSVNIASAPLAEIDDLLRHDGHPPLYYWLLHLWIDVFGDGDAAVRALSGVLGLAAIVLVYLVARRLAGPTLGVLAAVLLAVSPYGIRYSSEARMYELVVVLVLVGWMLLHRSVTPVPTGRAPRALVLVGLAVVSGALLLTHYWSMFLVAAVLVVLAAAAWRTPAAEDRRPIVASGVAVAAGGLYLLPWLSAMRYQMEHTGTPWAPAPRPTRVASESLVDFTGGAFPESTLLAVVMSALLVLGVFGRRTRDGLVLGAVPPGWRRPVLGVAVLTPAFGAVVALAADSTFAGRYASVFFPMVIVLAALGLSLVAPGWPRVAVLALVVVLGTVTVGGQMFTRDRTQAGVIADVIRAEASPGDLVVTCPDQLGPALHRLVDVPGVRVVRFPDLDEARLVDWVDYRERVEATDVAAVADRIVAEAGDGVVWLDWSDGYRFVGDACRELVTQLSARRPVVHQLVAGDNVEFFEYSTLLRFAPA